MTCTNLSPSETAAKIIADYKEHYSFPPQGESHMHDCIMVALDPCTECHYEGYVTAFYELAALMGIGAQPATPEKVWREQMLPRLRKALLD